MIVLHAVDHGDVSRADHLISALDHGVRRDSLVQWFLTQGCMRLIENKSDTGKVVKTFGLDKAKQEKLKASIASDTRAVVAGKLVREVPWYTSKKETDPMQALDLTKALRTLLAKAKKAASNPEIANKSDLSLLASLEKIIPVQSKLNR
jgi:hypothetical protein